MMLALRVEPEAEPAGEEVFRSEVIATLGVLRDLRCGLLVCVAAPVTPDDGFERAASMLAAIREALPPDGP